MSEGIGTIRVLVDRSRDWGCAGRLVELEPDTIYRTTDNRCALDEETLSRYHVLMITGHSPLAYSEEEIEIIRRFVEDGGGLLLATNTGRFERDVGGGVRTMAANRIGEPFGIRFLAPSEATGEMKLDDNLLRGYPREEIRLEAHEIWKDLDIGYLPLAQCSPVEGPENAEVLLRHEGTGDALALCFRFGKGRVVAFGDVDFANQSERICQILVDWLATGAEPSKLDGEIPDEILIEEKACERDGVTVYYVPFVEDRVDTCLDLMRRIHKELNHMFGKEVPSPKTVEIVPSCWTHRAYERSDKDWGLSIGALPTDPKLAYSIGCSLAEMFYRDIPDVIRYNVIEEDILRAHFGMKTMNAVGFEVEATAIYDAFMARFREKDPTGTELDIVRIGEDEEHRIPKGIWIWSELECKYGSDLFPRLIKQFPKEPRKGIPFPPFTDLDILVRGLSVAVCEDVFPWFREIGTTVHPLPLVEQDTSEFKEGVRTYLNEIFRDSQADVSVRLDALEGIRELDREEKKSSSNIAAQLESQDMYERCSAALRLAKLSDKRVRDILWEFASDGTDQGLRAMAALTLVQWTDPSIEGIFETFPGDVDDVTRQPTKHYQALRRSDCLAGSVVQD